MSDTAGSLDATHLVLPMKSEEENEIKESGACECGRVWCSVEVCDDMLWRMSVSWNFFMRESRGLWA